MPGHGKNEVDGVGPVVKNCVRRSVLEGEFVTDATSIHSLVAQRLKSSDTLTYSSVEILSGDF